MKQFEIIKKYKKGWKGLHSEHPDFAKWLSIELQEQKQQMIEKGEGLKKPSGEIQIITELKDGSYLQGEFNGYNQAITDYQNLIKE